MSMPRDGSSSRTTLGRVASILPITTFCWLPPESEPIIAPPPSVLMWTLRIERSMISCSREREVKTPRVNSPIEASERLLADGHGLHQPVALAVLRHEDEAGGDALGDGEARDVAAVEEDAAAGGLAGARRRVSIISVRPAPIRP